MAMRKLADPILNDLLLMLQGRRLNDLTPAAQSRYIQHLDRLDHELATARAAGGSIPLAFNDKSVLITVKELEKLRGRLVQHERALDTANEELGPATAKATTLEQFGDVLFAEFAMDLALIETKADTPTAAALDLLRAFKADLDRLVGAPVQASAHDTPSPTGKPGNRSSR